MKKIVLKKCIVINNMLLNLSLELESKNTAKIIGLFTRDYINDIMLPGISFVANSDAAIINLDLKDTTFCDSAAVAFVVYLWRLASKQNKKIKLNNVSEKMLSIMQISGIDNILLDN